jgi:hypothetical protein
MMKVQRMMPRKDRPYIFFSPSAPYASIVLFFGIGQEEEGQALLLRKRLVRFFRICAHSQDFDAPLFELAVAVAETAGLGRAAWGAVPGIEVQHEGSAAKIRKGPCFSISVFEREVGRPFTFLNHSRSSFSAIFSVINIARSRTARKIGINAEPHRLALILKEAIHMEYNIFDIYLIFSS